jgi:hypothetical protein
MMRKVSGWVKDSKEGSIVVTFVFIDVVDDVVDVPYRLLFGVRFFEVKHIDKSVYLRQPARLILRKGIGNGHQ